MKINWKVPIALVLIVGVSYWAAYSVFPRSYSGPALDFKVGSGTVTVTNPSNESIPAQLVAKSGSFRVSSAIAGLSGSSTRQGSGSSASNLFEFVLSPGVNEFAISRGRDVNFVASAETNLKATVQPVSTSTARTTIIVAVAVVLASLFYISRTTGHRWISILGHQKTSIPELKPAVAGSVAGGQGRPSRSYGDNRESKGD
jgi:preprotein translocase subunit SecE